MNELLDEYQGRIFELSEEYENSGICYVCGAVQDGVEPDAEGYECHDCGKHAVGGIIMAMLQI